MSETRKLTAILVSDVVGYSRLAGADEDRILARLRTLRSDLIDPTIAVHHGRIVKRTGDGSVIEFRSVVDAVRCAIELQNAMVERNAGVTPERRIEFRVGIHVGDVVEEADGDLMGDGVNIAARLQSVAKPGAICLSEQAYWQVKGRLDLAVTDLGPTELKNIAQPIHVYSLQVGVPAQAKPASAAQPTTQAKPPEAVERWARGPLAAGIAVLLLLIGASAWWWFLGANRPAPVASNAPQPLAAQRLSIVVLPFGNLSGDPSQDYLADALTDQLTTSLARLGGTFVIARNTAFTFKGKPVDAKAIGKDLGVRYVLEGSVQPSSNQVRVNAQLIDADSGAHLWAEQFDTPRANLLQTQDEIITHLAHEMEIQLAEAEVARLKRAPPTHPDAEDLALQCYAATILKNALFGKEADAGYRLCEQALAADPNNVAALTILANKFNVAAGFGLSADPEADFKRADELASHALAVDPNDAGAHTVKAFILNFRGRPGEAIPEAERALALDPAAVEADANLGWDYAALGQNEKSLEYFDRAIRLSPHDPDLNAWYSGKSVNYFILKQYDQTIEWCRRAIAVSPKNNPFPHARLVAALALSGHEAEAREALQHYLALPTSGPRTIKAWRALNAQYARDPNDPSFLDWSNRWDDGLRKAGMPEE